MKINILGMSSGADKSLPRPSFLNLYSTGDLCVGNRYSTVRDAEDVRSDRSGGPYPGCIVKIEATAVGDFNITIVREFK